MVDTSRMVVLTPSFAQDFELCADLHRSVLTYAPATVHHHLVVPGRDIELFAQLAGPRTHIHRETEFLPRSFVKAPFGRYTVNVRRPFPPIRGWILQQIIKLAAAAEMDADVVLLVDSDIEFVRPFASDAFQCDGVVRLYRKRDEIDERLPRHVLWHGAARTLLGLEPPRLPMSDYVSSLLAWDPSVVRRLLERVERTTRRRWVDAVGAQLHFSEWTLYGVFVDEILGSRANSNASDRSLCHSHWDDVALDERSALDFIGGFLPGDLACMISAKSRTPMAVRRRILDALRTTEPSQQDGAK